MAFSEYDYSPAARTVMGAATRAGVTKESIGQWKNLAMRWQSAGRLQEELDCLEHALAIHKVWGVQHAVYSMAPHTLERTERRIAELRQLEAEC